MAITIQGMVVINPVQSRAFTTERDDSGFSRQAMTVTGYTERTATLAAAKEIARQLNEMAANYWYRTVHVVDSEDSQYDGLYDLASAGVTATPATANSMAALFAVSVTLRRLGGAGLHGANVTRRVSTLAVLTANSYSITALAYTAPPVGGQLVPTTTPTAAVSRASEEGTMSGAISTAPAPTDYVFTGADLNKGECQLWDTAPNPDVRVWSTDHTFANDADVMLDNGLVRVGGSTTDGCHFVQVWDSTSSAWQNVVISDLTRINGNTTHSCIKVTITELSPWRITVVWSYFMAATSPYHWSKAVTIERGKHLAKIVITPVAATGMLLQPMTSRFFLTRRTTDTACAIDDTVDGSVAVSLATDNVMMGFANTASRVLFVAAVSSSSLTAGYASPIRYISTAGASSMTVWLGGVSYNCATAQGEAEAGTLIGGALLGAGLSADSGNSVVIMNALGMGVNMSALTSPPTGSRVMAWFRIASDTTAASANAGNTLKLGIFNSTLGADAASVTLLATNATYFAVANTLVWAGLEYTTWNGTDVLFPFVNKTGSATAASFFVDEVVFLTLNGPNYDKPRDLATLAMTDQYVWESVNRAVW